MKVLFTIKDDTQMRVKIPEDKLESAGFFKENVRDGYFYRDYQYLGSFIRRANSICYGSSGHGSYGQCEIEIIQS